MYKWQLEKYEGSKSRFTCPSCGKKNQFTRYKDSEGNYADNHFGVCNRVIKCGYKKYPNSETNADYFPRYTPPVKYETINGEIYNDKFNECNPSSNFVQFLFRYYDNQDVINILNKYHIRTDGDKIVFPYINKDNLLTAVKVMEYDKEGHRTKYIYNPFKGNYKACLFGLHLHDHKKMCVVESEKTAIISALEYPEFTWVATGGLNNYSRMNDLLSAEVFPDKGKSFEYWKEKTNFPLNETLENKEFLKDGDDLADYILYHK